MKPVGIAETVLVAGFLLYLAVGLIRSIARTEPEPRGWCDRLGAVCPFTKR